MTGEQPPRQTGNTVDCGDASLYVLGLMDAEQRAQFLVHVETCVVCRDEIAALRPAVRVLDEAVPRVSAPRRLRRRVLSAARTESVSSPSARGQERLRTTPLLRLARPRALAVAAASCALLVVGGTIGALVLADTPAREAAHVRGEVTVQGASAVLHRSGSHVWLTVSHMPSPGKNHVYEIWIERGSSEAPLPTSALFSPTAKGACTVAVPGNLPSGSRVLVTSEPDGGTLEPTAEPVIVAKV
ncbi:MAG TPA: anti-sigma factor [Solirubrobacteraceae bacterium]|jgi:hypothetical protein